VESFFDEGQMADSIGGGFPRSNIQYGHLHYTHETKTLWMYIGDDPRSSASWVSIFSQHPLDETRLTENQRGSVWLANDGTLKRWTGTKSVDAIDIKVEAVQRKLRPKSFTIYDATNYTSKPNLLALYDVKQTIILYEGMLFGGQPDHAALPLQATVTALGNSVAALPNETLIITDIESYQYYTDDAIGAQQRQHIITVHNWLYAVKPTMNLGMYAHIPKREYESVNHTSVGLALWQARNNLTQEVVPSVRFLAPSLYTFHENHDEWIRYATANIREARRYAGGLPIYPFIWFRYHDSLPNIGGTALSADYWSLQLNILRELTDGVIIWNNEAVPWNETLPWWVATKAFMTSV